MTAPTIYWHDYETFGTDPRRDRPAQFAGIRTDLDFNIIGEPLNIYCKLSPDYLPNPDACLLTGITPIKAQKLGFCEAEFTAQIYQQLVQANTCTIGYNSLRFDDEFTRNCLYRNFYDPYVREWQQGNSRWDIIDVVRAAAALRPDGIVWPVDEENKSCFKLEALTEANSLQHEAAHDALSDVYATIAIAKLIKNKQPKLFQFLFAHRSKTEVSELLQLGSFKPVVHVSGKYAAIRHCLAIVLPICKHPVNANGVIVYDLSQDPEPLLQLSAAEIKQRVFTASHQLPEGVERIALKTVHLNKCPIIAPITVIRAEDEIRLALDLSLINKHVAIIKNSQGLADKLAEVFSLVDFETEQDPDLAIYSGGFFSAADKQKMAKIRSAGSAELSNLSFNFTDKRLSEMFFRYKARNYPEILDTAELLRWKQYCKSRLLGIEKSLPLSITEYESRLQALKNQTNSNGQVIKELECYLLELTRQLELSIKTEQIVAI
ncbi:MAG: exodeoxyribonuclease I [Methylococcaceae bacterium]|jgi:exodeoxyribonuclease-1